MNLPSSSPFNSLGVGTYAGRHHHVVNVENLFQHRYADLHQLALNGAHFSRVRARLGICFSRGRRGPRRRRATCGRGTFVIWASLSCLSRVWPWLRSNSLIATNSAVRGRARLKIWQVGDLGCRTRATRLFERGVARSCVYAKSAINKQPHSLDVDHGVEFLPKIILSRLASVRLGAAARGRDERLVGFACLLVTYTPLATIIVPQIFLPMQLFEYRSGR